MDENSTLRDLAEKLEKSKKLELEQMQAIESEKLRELRERFSELLRRELSTIEIAMQAIESELEDHRREITKKISKVGSLKIFFVWITPLLLILALGGGAAGGWYLHQWLMPPQVEKRWIVPQQMRREGADVSYIRVPADQIYNEEGSTMKWVKIGGGR